MACPRYSVLYNAFNLQKELDNIAFLLKEGIKVIWFGSIDDERLLTEMFPEFLKCRLLQAFISPLDKRLYIIDGDVGADSAVFSILSECSKFDYEQYLAEHSGSKYLLVQASAGTGKTSVMVDRVLFLMHTVDNLDPSQITMITFTRDAADQMCERLQGALLTRYELTGKQKYLELLEGQSRMRISTIHSFALDLIKRFGGAMGLSKDVGIRTLSYETDAVITRLIDSECDSCSPVIDQIGLPIYEARRLIHGFWDDMLNIGLSDSEISCLDWGEPVDTASAPTHCLLSDIIPKLVGEYKTLKTKGDAVTLSDMVRDLDSIIAEVHLDSESVGIRYLFIDEFQDSDDSQIRVILRLSETLGLSLFAVGDVKQSIYRFRGADDSAFQKLRDGLNGCGFTVEDHQLRNNYRTSPAIIEDLDHLFEGMKLRGFLDYPGKSNPYRDMESDGFEVEEIYRTETEEQFLVEDLRSSLDDLRRRLAGGEARPSDKVVVLTRSNNDLRRVEAACMLAHIPVVVKRSGSFYTSEAVRDFFSAISSFIFHDPIHLFNYLSSPYSSCEQLPDAESLLKSEGNEDELIDFLWPYLESTTWEKYDSKLRFQPVMSVMMDMIGKEPVLDNYISNEKARLIKTGYSEQDVVVMVRENALQYRADLDKLLDVLQRNLRGSSNDLYGLYDFLRIKMVSDRDEESAEIEGLSGPGCVYAMTVHKAKGLEFDTVFIPFTNKRFNQPRKSEIIIDENRRRVGWKYSSDSSQKLQNGYYNQMSIREKDSQRNEEVRILYVALTRAIRRLKVYVRKEHNRDSWADLIYKEWF